MNLMNLVYKNARYMNAEQNYFDVEVTDIDGELLEGASFLFTYCCDGSDDENSPVSQAVGEAFRQGTLDVEGYVAPPYAEEVSAAELRAQRDSLLSASDYFVVADYPASDADKDAVRAYRQALRDITEQEGFPHDVVWPDKPEVLK